MPILDIQTRFRELGRIRMGDQQPTGRKYDRGPKKGEPMMRPSKLPVFRLTSPWQRLIEQAAEVFGGEARPWDNDGSAEWEVYTDPDPASGLGVLPVVIPPGCIFDQWNELWQGGGLVRRCDGLRQVLVDRPCSCPADPMERQEKAAKGEACKPTTRLRLMLPDVADIGIWRLESHGFHAAAELGGAAGLVEAATRQGAMIPAELRVQAREGSRRPGVQRKKFFVPAIAFRGALGPVLDALGILEAGSEMPRLLGVQPRPALDAGGRGELPPAGTAFDPAPVEEASFPGPVPEPEPAGPVDEVQPKVDTPPEPAAFEPPAAEAKSQVDDGLGEPAAFEPPAVADDDTAQRSYTGPQIIAMRLQDLGVTDRAARLRAVSSIVGRAVESSKDLKATEIRTVLARLDELDEPDPEWATVAEPPGGSAPLTSRAAPGEVVTPDVVDRPIRRRRVETPPAAPQVTEPSDWDGDRWREFLAKRGVKATEVLKEAAKLGREGETPPPATLDDIGASGLASLLVGFVEDLSLSRKS